MGVCVCGCVCVCGVCVCVQSGILTSLNEAVCSGSFSIPLIYSSTPKRVTCIKKEAGMVNKN